jgi:hypothetical protein
MNWKNTTTAALVLSFGMMTGAYAQDQDRHEDRRDDQRHYDTRNNNNNYQWSDQETPYYRQWYSSTYGSGREYREFNQMSPEEQHRYWEWRRSHRDNDHHDRDDREHHEHDDNPHR